MKENPAPKRKAAKVDVATIPKGKPPISSKAPQTPAQEQPEDVATEPKKTTGATSSQAPQRESKGAGKENPGRHDASTQRNSDQGTPQTSKNPSKIKTGDDTLAVAEPATEYAVDSSYSLPLAHARLDETRGMCWERLRKEGRAAGMPKGQGPGTAYEWATRETERLFPPPPPPEPEPEEDPPELAEPEPIPEPVAEDLEPESATEIPAPAADQGVSGLGTIPEAWPALPDNASLQAEISWVSANRLRVRDGTGVDLSKASVPAPSYSALSWLETSILFPSKFADISVKATSQQDDEREQVRRERMAIEDVRRILAEMLEDEPPKG